MIDPPRRSTEYDLTDEETSEGDSIVEVTYYCDSSSGGWRAGSVIWHAVLLLTATVIAFQTRNLRDEYNESRILATLIYSHFVFVLCRVALFALEDSLGVWTSARLVSLVVSMDVIATCGIYFLPKFLSDDKKQGDGRGTHPDRLSISRASYMSDARGSFMSGVSGLVCSECSNEFCVDYVSRDSRDSDLPSAVEGISIARDFRDSELLPSVVEGDEGEEEPSEESVLPRHEKATEEKQPQPLAVLKEDAPKKEEEQLDTTMDEGDEEDPSCTIPSESSTPSESEASSPSESSV